MSGNWLATTRRTGNHAFTLIELLIAVALSVILILLCFTTFRSVVTTIVTLKEAAADNALLRSGYLMATEDADRWRSQAEPGYPYLRQHLCQDDNSNSIYDVQPFKPVSWPASLDAADNPNWAQAHDPRSWYRGHLLPSGATPGRKYVIPVRDAPITSIFERVNTFAVDMSQEELDAQWPKTGFSPQDDRKLSTMTRERIATPPGWNTWHAVGDYTILSHIDMDTTAAKPDNPTNDDPLARNLGGWRARQLWASFQRLGVRGCNSYLHRGSLNLITAPMSNEVTQSYLVDDNHDPRLDSGFLKGEIPWDAYPGVDQLLEKEITVLDGQRPQGDVISYPRTFVNALQHPIPGLDATHYNRQNYALLIPDFFGIASSSSAGSALPLLADFSSLEGAGTHVRMRVRGGAQPGDLQKMTLIYPGTPDQADLSGRNYQWANFYQTVIDPYQVPQLDGKKEWTERDHKIAYTNAITNEKVLEEALLDNTAVNFRRRHQRWTWRQPLNATDAVEPDLTTPGSDIQRTSALATAVMRYRSGGNDKARCTIHLQSPDAKSRSISFNMFTTDFRGARQYWGRMSASGFDDGLGHSVQLGDRYE